MGYSPLRILENVRYQADLMALLEVVALIDTDAVDPESASSNWRPHAAKSRSCTRWDGYAFVVHEAVIHKSGITPRVADRLVLRLWNTFQ